MPLDAIDTAIAAIRRGEIIVVVDDEDRENEGDLVMAAEFATPEKIAFFVKHTSGLICAPVTSREPMSSTCRSWSRPTPSRTSPPSPSRWITGTGRAPASRRATGRRRSGR